ncbi:hypothetical protein JHK85_041694 [Glycine max]|nr:hypothetical protein JHK85_041694 [Glycine max]
MERKRHLLLSQSQAMPISQLRLQLRLKLQQSRKDAYAVVGPGVPVLDPNFSYNHRSYQYDDGLFPNGAVY